VGHRLQDPSPLVPAPVCLRNHSCMIRQASRTVKARQTRFLVRGGVPLRSGSRCLPSCRRRPPHAKGAVICLARWPSMRRRADCR
jgi:hypothetical protein